MGSIDKSIKGFTAAWGYSIAGIGFGAAVAGFVSLGKRAIEAGDDLNKAAIKAGVTGEAISELAYAAKLSDVDLGSLSTALRKMQQNLSEAASGGKAQIETLQALGLSIKDLQALAPDRQFELIADRISQLKDPADRSRAAVEEFGRAGADLLPMFEQGAEGIRMAREEAQRLGLSFSGDQLKALADADDAVKKMKASLDGLALTLTAKVAPALADFANAWTATLAGGKARYTLELQVASESLDRAKAAGADPESLARIQKRIDDLKKELGIVDAAAKAATTGNGPAIKPPPGFKAAADKDGKGKGAKGDSYDWLMVNASARDVDLRNAESYFDKLNELTQTSAEKDAAEFQKLYTGLEVLRTTKLSTGQKDDLGNDIAKAAISAEEYIKRLKESLKNAGEVSSATFDGIIDSLRQMRDAGDITAQQFEDAYTAAMDAVLSEVDVTSSKLWDTVSKDAKKASDKVSEITLEMKRNIQDILGDSIRHALDGGLDELPLKFSELIADLSAQAAAAQIGELLFGTDDEKGGGGWIGDAIGTLFGGKGKGEQIKVTPPGMAGVMEAIPKVAEIVPDQFKVIEDVAGASSDKIGGAFQSGIFDTFADGLEGMQDGFKGALANMTVQAAAAQIGSSLMGGNMSGPTVSGGKAGFWAKLAGFAGQALSAWAGGGFGGGAGAGQPAGTIGNVSNWGGSSGAGTIGSFGSKTNWGANLFPGYATGGEYDGSTPFWAGENGKELIIPKGSGTVLNARESAAADKEIREAASQMKGHGYIHGFVAPLLAKYGAPKSVADWVKFSQMLGPDARVDIVTDAGEYHGKLKDYVPEPGQEATWGAGAPGTGNAYGYGGKYDYLNNYSSGGGMRERATGSPDMGSLKNPGGFLGGLAMPALTGGITGKIGGFSPGGGIGSLLSGMAGSLSSDGGSVLENYAKGGVAGAVTGGGDSKGGLVGGVVGKMFGFATGGVASGAAPFVVGESGPEVVVPQGAARVFNSAQSKQMMNGGSPIVVNVNGVTDFDSFRRSEGQIRASLVRAASRSQMRDV